MMGEGRIRVLIADEHSLFRESLRALLESQGDLLVVAEASDGLQAVDAAERVRPDVVLIEAESPNCDGIRATAMIAARVPEARVVVLGESEEGETLVEALEAGARGYLSRESRVEELIQGIRSVHRGGTAVTATMVGYLVDRLLRRRREQDDARRRVYQLSPREREVLALLVRGGDNDGIAQALVISPQTARTHIQNMLPKLGVHSRLEAAAFVARHGLIDELVPAG